MSRFLRAGLIADRASDIIEASAMLLREAGPDNPRITDLAADIAAMAADLRDFIARWDCEPLIYTGRGTTDEVISLLDSLLNRADDRRRAGLQG